MAGRNKGADSVRIEHISRTIFLLRGHRVILDADLAALYLVPTKRLNRAEIEELNRSRIATGSQKHRDPRFPPFAFTEHGAIMAATVLNSPRAVEMSLYVVRAFIQLRELLASNAELASKLKGHDDAIIAILSAIRELMSPPIPERRGIGFTADFQHTE